jgi:hypothetical protein
MMAAAKAFDVITNPYNDLSYDAIEVYRYNCWCNDEEY